MARESLQSIPSIFYSIETNQPFSRCSSCDCDLTSNDVHYLVEKAFRQYPGYTSREVVFEYAVCFPCAMKMRQELSQESLSNLENYFSFGSMAVEDMIEADDFMVRCAIKGTVTRDLTEFQIVAHCQGEKLLPGFSPILIGGEAIDEMGNLLSNKTNDEMNRFIDDFTGLPPEFKDLIKDNKPVLV